MRTAASPIDLSHRARAILSATAEGRVAISCSCEPDLLIDELACCDQSCAHHLVHIGLVTHAHVGTTGTFVPATLTTRGRAMLTEEPA